jgi:hypothetical protein
MSLVGFPFFNVDRQTDAEHPHRRPVMLAAEIMQMLSHHMLVLRPGMPGALLQKVEWFRDPQFMDKRKPPSDIPQLSIVVQMASCANAYYYCAIAGIGCDCRCNGLPSSQCTPRTDYPLLRYLYASRRNFGFSPTCVESSIRRPLRRTAGFGYAGHAAKQPGSARSC